MALSKEMAIAAAEDLQELAAKEEAGVHRAQEVLDLARKGRSPLAQALINDYAARLDSYKRCKAHLIEREEEDNRISPWVWNVLFFILGMLTAMSEPAMFNLIWNFVKAHGAG